MLDNSNVTFLALRKSPFAAVGTLFRRARYCNNSSTAPLGVNSSVPAPLNVKYTLLDVAVDADEVSDAAPAAGDLLLNTASMKLNWLVVDPALLHTRA